MYRCIECKAVFETKLDYCDCGNDEFEEFYNAAPPVQQQSFSQETQNLPPVAKKVYNFKEIASMAIFTICIILSIFAWIFVGRDASGQKNSHNSSQQGAGSTINYNIPDINDIWDNTLPTAQEQHGVPTEAPKPKELLNSKMNTLSSQMTTYVLTLGQTFVSTWPRGTVVGDGACEIEFAVGRDGKVIDKKIYKASNNKTLDDSVAIMMENVTQVTPPPPDYHGENIIMAFSIQHREFKVYYPHY